MIGVAVTRDGIPVHVCPWLGNACDQTLIRQAQDDMRDWTLSKILWVADRGFPSGLKRRYCAAAPILRRRPRSGPTPAPGAR